jgi:PPE-repeat protein
MARWNGKMGSVEIFDLTTETWSQVFSESGVGDQGYIDEWKEFTDASLAMPIQSATALDGLKALKVVDAAKTSNTLKTCIFLSALENKAEGKL